MNQPQHAARKKAGEYRDSNGQKSQRDPAPDWRIEPVSSSPKAAADSVRPVNRWSDEQAAGSGHAVAGKQPDRTPVVQSHPFQLQIDGLAVDGERCRSARDFSDENRRGRPRAGGLTRRHRIACRCPEFVLTVVRAAGRRSASASGGACAGRDNARLSSNCCACATSRNDTTLLCGVSRPSGSAAWAAALSGGLGRGRCAGN